MTAVFDSHAHCLALLLLLQTRCDFTSGNERAAILGGNLERLYPAA